MLPTTKRSANPRFVQYQSERFAQEMLKTPLLHTEIPISFFLFVEDAMRRIGGGTFADIYQVETKRGTVSTRGTYALKIIKPRTESEEMQFIRATVSQKMMRNINASKAVLAQPPFVKPIVISDANWYIMEYIEGNSVDYLRRKGMLDNATKAKATCAYMNALALLHHNGLTMGDENWGAVIIDQEGNPHVCDYDTVQSLNNRHQTIDRIFTPEYAILKEHHDPTVRDLKGFARMVLAIYNNNIEYLPAGMHAVMHTLLNSKESVPTCEVQQLVHTHLRDS